MKKILAVIALTLTLTTFAFADSKNSNDLNAAPSTSMATSQNSVFGQIVDFNSYSPLNCAVITISTNGNKDIRRITSNNNGLFEISGLSNGTYEVTVSFPGCDNIKMNVKISGSSADMGVIELK